MNLCGAHSVSSVRPILETSKHYGKIDVLSKHWRAEEDEAEDDIGHMFKTKTHNNDIGSLVS